MPNSVRCIIKKCLHKGAINQQEFDKIMRKLDEPIKCKDCVHWKHSSIRPNYCDVWDWCNMADDFCSFAERREEE